MPRNKINDIVEGRILSFLQLKISQRQIVKILGKDGISVSQKTISNAKRRIGLQRISVEKIKFSRRRPVSTPSTISKILEKIDVNDPLTQRSIAKLVHASQSTISRVVKSARFQLRKKCKVHKLTEANAEKRRKRARLLYRRLANHRYRNFITTDESWFYLDGTEGKRRVCYIKKTGPDYERMLLQKDSTRPKGFMVWAAISSCGKTSLRFVKLGAKINSDYYMNNILKPFMPYDYPRLLRNGGKRNMIFHQDSAPSHVSKKTMVFLNLSKINYIKPVEWMPKSPDAAPMDYAVWGYLKQQLKKEKIETLDELKKKTCKALEKDNSSLY